jgi:hypothetical protein
MKEILTITGTARITPKNEGIDVYGLFPSIMTNTRKRIAVIPDVKIESNTERGYIPAALHLNEQY